MNKFPEEINLSVKSVNFENWSTDQSAYASILNPLLNKPITPDVNIIHMTPENFQTHYKPGIKNIGYTVWETSKLPAHWVPMCNKMDAIWVPCQWNIDVFRDSGVTVPLKKIEHTIDMAQFENVQAADLGLPKDKFTFYSIFQWTERKNPVGLIKAFLSEFSESDNVALVLKTYRQDNSERDKKWIEQEILNIKQSMFIYDHPPVMIIHKMLSRQEILALHKAGDCMVMPHRAEGWSCTHFEAMAMGTPAIGTNFGGNTEFMNHDNSYLLDYHPTPVAGMPWKLYNGKSMWAEPSIGQLQTYMRGIYTDRSRAQGKAEKAKLDVQKYSWENIGKKIVEELSK
jgi:glycosyltransferase involved in cell wall biosynthesis